MAKQFYVVVIDAMNVEAYGNDIWLHSLYHHILALKWSSYGNLEAAGGFSNSKLKSKPISKS